MKKAELDKLVLGSVATNVWFLKNKETGELLIVDPADEQERILQKVRQMEGKPVGILLTHGHFDHILAAEFLRKHLGAEIYAMTQEQALLEDPDKNLSGMWTRRPVCLKADHFLSDNQELSLAGFTIRVLHTPGHTAGSCCYYLEDEQILISGDTLFLGDVGRTDMPTASGADMRRSISRLLSELPDGTHVYPGHDEETTIGYEKIHNIYSV